MGKSIVNWLRIQQKEKVLTDLSESEMFCVCDSYVIANS